MKSSALSLGFHTAVAAAAVVMGVIASQGCAGESIDGDWAPDSESGAARTATANEAAAEERVIEESDIYRIDGDYLYVQNSATGLNIIDISDAANPALVATADVAGAAGELYVRGSSVFVLFEGRDSACVVPSWMDVGAYAGRSEVVTLDGAPDHPSISARYCLPGNIVASRLVGDVLYVAAREYAPDQWGGSGRGRSWIFSFDVSDPADVRMADKLTMDGLSTEIHATNEVIFLAQRTDDGSEQTIVRYIDISNPNGTMEERGQIIVSGRPAGRFHMDAYEDMFRIVTSSGEWESLGTNLHVIDVSDPDALTLISSLEGIAPGEELHATHFVGEWVYIVTYENIREFFDPLFIVSLEDPAEPRVTSELQVPGWSDYIFPMGDRLVAVGRGDRGDRVAVALYDISNPYESEELARDEFGGENASSEANIDFRGVTIVNQGVLGEDAMLVVPYTHPYVSQYGCEDPGQFLQLWDLRFNSIERRGAAEQLGTIRRSVVVEEFLYSISDEQIGVVDVDDRDAPATVATVTVGDGSQIAVCTAFGDLGDGGCRASARPPSASDATVALLALVGVATFLGVARRRR